jgi:8-oxo-dGTP diphosphatase
VAIIPNPRVEVVAGVIRRADSKILLSLRHKDAHQGGLWEFPGGKREPNESRFATLKRELHEELGITIHRATPLLRLQYEYPTKAVELDTWEVSHWDGAESGREGQQIVWVPPSQLHKYSFPAANEPIIRAASLPRILLTRSLSAANDAFPVEQFKSRTSAGLGNCLQFSASVPARSRKVRIIAGVELCREIGTKLLFIDEAIGERGIVSKTQALNFYDLGDHHRDIFVGVVCKETHELRRAELNGADFGIVLAQNFDNRRVGLSGIEWTELENLVQRTNIPVYIKGDFDEIDLARAISAGCQGIALHRSFLPTDLSMLAKATELAETRDVTEQIATRDLK